MDSRKRYRPKTDSPPADTLPSASSEHPPILSQSSSQGSTQEPVPAARTAGMNTFASPPVFLAKQFAPADHADDVASA